jgi:uncharacterized protein YndB with AHSA1/START domain
VADADGGAVLVVRKVLGASAEFLFDAWTQPALMARWFHARPTWTTEIVRSDLRVGGGWELVMHGEDGPTCRVFGKYLALERPTRLAFTWHPDERDDYETVVNLTFKSLDRDTTELVLTHTALGTEADRERHGQGWERCLAGLAALVEARAHVERGS